MQSCTAMRDVWLRGVTPSDRSSGSASDMDVSAGEDVDAVDSGDGADSDTGGQPEAAGPHMWTYEGIYKDAAEKERHV